MKRRDPLHISHEAVLAVVEKIRGLPDEQVATIISELFDAYREDITAYYEHKLSSMRSAAVRKGIARGRCSHIGD